MYSEPFMARQGDVLVMPVGSIPRTATEGQRDQGRIVLAYGEITGHSHSIADPSVQILEYEGTRYIHVPQEGAKLKHEEHRAIELAPGDYRVVTQKEYTPKAIVNVLD